MATVLITGAAGLIGSEATHFFISKGFSVVGIDNDLRAHFFGSAASTNWNRDLLIRRYPRQYHHNDLDVRDRVALEGIFQNLATEIVLVIHAAAQPSHDWAARHPQTDFSVNAVGTLNMLELTRQYSPGAVFIFTSTNKVYGDTPNQLPLEELETRWELPAGHRHISGIDESMSVDQSMHSLFGVSKLSADLLVQEYGRYFGLKSACFRGGCLTGPAHSGAELHGFLAYLMKCTTAGTEYTVYGYKGKQVRDNIHSYDLVTAFYHFYLDPRYGEVYNIGGSRHCNCSMLEAIDQCQEIAGKELNYRIVDQNRAGDHVWYISDVRKFQSHYPDWRYTYTLQEILKALCDEQTSRIARKSKSDFEG